MDARLQCERSGSALSGRLGGGGILNNPQPQSEPYEKPASPDTLLPLYHLRFCLISELSLHGDAVAAAAQTL